MKSTMLSIVGLETKSVLYLYIWDKLDKYNFADPNENYHILETEIIKQRLKHLLTKKSNIRNINTKNQDGLLME